MNLITIGDQEGTKRDCPYYKHGKKLKTVTMFNDVKNHWKNTRKKDSMNVLRARNNGSRESEVSY